MSGIEIAGLVLGGFPLLISAAEHYKDGFEPLVKWYRFRGDFIRFIDAVETEQVLYNQTVERFLISADVPDSELQQFLRDSEYEGWQRTDLVDLLRSRLGPAYDVYISTIKRIRTLLIELQKVLLVKKGKGSEFEVEWAKDGASRWSYQMKRICLSFSKKGTVLVEELERHNKNRKDTTWAKIFYEIRCHANNLYTVLKKGWKCDCEAAHPTALRLQHRKSESSPDFSLYITIPDHELVPAKVRKEITVSAKRSIIPPTPSTPKPANPLKDEYLSVLRRDFEPQTSVTSRPGHTSSVSETTTSTRSSFKTMFSWSDSGRASNGTSSFNDPEVLLEEKPRKWVSAKTVKSKKVGWGSLPSDCAVQAAPSQPPPPQPVPGTPASANLLLKIDNLCKAFCSGRSGATCLGYVGDDGSQQYDLRQACECRADDNECSISLESLLNNDEGLVFSRQQRYKVASVLASSLLQLQTTPWLQDKMDKSKIFFYRQGQDVLFEHPYVRHSFLSTKAQEALIAPLAPPLPPHFAARSSLNNLGTLLLELCFGKPVESCELRKYHLGIDGKPHERTNWSTTRDWAEMVCEEDPRLEHVINCCVFDILFLQQKPDWESKEFVQAVYLSVVEPLDKLNGAWQPN